MTQRLTDYSVSSWIAAITAAGPEDLPLVTRKWGSWHHADLEWMTAQVRDVPGDFAEIGVFKGAAFQKVAMLAAEQGKLAHAFDSFVGMDEPSAFDGPQYPKGKFDIGGPAQFTRLMTNAGVPEDFYLIWAGYVPTCYDLFPADAKFSFVILDLDQYKPTEESLPWIMPRLNSGGILALDDFVPAERHSYNTKAICDYFEHDDSCEIVAYFNQQLIVRKR